MSKLKNFEIKNGVLKKYVGAGGAVSIPEGVTSISEDAFGGCGFESINIPNSVTSIGDSAFRECEKLTSIGESAFRWCEKLTIFAPAGSYAEQYAKENGINFAESV